LTHKTKYEVKEKGGGRREKVRHPLLHPQNNLGAEDDGT